MKLTNISPKKPNYFIRTLVCLCIVFAFSQQTIKADPCSDCTTAYNIAENTNEEVFAACTTAAIIAALLSGGAGTVAELACLAYYEIQENSNLATYNACKASNCTCTYLHLG